MTNLERARLIARGETSADSDCLKVLIRQLVAEIDRLTRHSDLCDECLSSCWEPGPTGRVCGYCRLTSEASLLTEERDVLVTGVDEALTTLWAAHSKSFTNDHALKLLRFLHDVRSRADWSRRQSEASEDEGLRVPPP